MPIDLIPPDSAYLKTSDSACSANCSCTMAEPSFVEWAELKVDLISLLHDVVYAPEYGTAEDEADSWDGLSHWMGE